MAILLYYNIMYYDENNLYGWSMSQPLPIGNFKWGNEDYYKSGKSCIIEEYPKDLEKYPLIQKIFTNRTAPKNETKYPLMPP